MRIFAFVLLLVTSAYAQQPAYAPPDRELWDAMIRALSEVPMSVSAHQQVQRLLGDIQREAQMREAAKARSKKD